MTSQLNSSQDENEELRTKVECCMGEIRETKEKYNHMVHEYTVRHQELEMQTANRVKAAQEEANAAMTNKLSSVKMQYENELQTQVQSQMQVLHGQLQQSQRVEADLTNQLNDAKNQLNDCVTALKAEKDKNQNLFNQLKEIR